MLQCCWKSSTVGVGSTSLEVPPDRRNNRHFVPGTQTRFRKIAPQADPLEPINGSNVFQSSTNTFRCWLQANDGFQLAFANRFAGICFF
jgi:hypothetical protein